MAPPEHPREDSPRPLHPLLARQLRRHLGESVPASAEPAEWTRFLTAVSDAYEQFDRDRRMTEHSLELMSEELNQRNDELRRELAERRDAETALEREKAEQAVLIERLADARQQLFHAEKMASIGQLAAGVAHEINNPVGYVHANLGALGNYVDDLLQLAGLVEALSAALPADHPQRAQAEAACRNLDPPFLREDIPSLMRETAEGVARVRKIVADLRDFSHPDSGGFTVVDLHQGLRSTLNIVHNELKYKCEVCTDFGELPQIECNPGQLNQVFLNLLVNAGHAIAERGRIEILTRSHAERGEVSVAITDTGCGIAAEHLGRIFDPFFTTKSVGKGTGLGLSLSYGIVQRHNGRIEVDSAPGRGSTFRVVLPVSQPADAPPA